MIGKIVTAIVSICEKNDLISKADLELYRFGINRLILFVVNLISALVVGAFCGMLIESVIFSIAYICLRRYSGGYHAQSAGKCYIYSILLIVAALAMVKGFMQVVYVTFPLLLIADWIVFRYSPVESINKPLNQAEHDFFRKTARVILLIENLIALVTCYHCKLIAICVSVSIVFCAMMIVIPQNFRVKK